MANWAAGSRGVGPGVKRRVFRIMSLLYRGWGGRHMEDEVPPRINTYERGSRPFVFYPRQSALIRGRTGLFCSLRQLGLDHFGDEFAVCAQARREDALLDDLHDGAHVARTGFGAAARSHVGDGRLNDLADLVFAGRLGHIDLDHRDLSLLLGGEFGAVALGEALDRLSALLQQGGQDLGLLRVREGLALVDLFRAQGGLDHAQRCQAMLVAGLHRGDDIGVDRFADAHWRLALPDPPGGTFSLKSLIYWCYS